MRKTGHSVIAVVLSLVMMVTMMAVGGFSAAAAEAGTLPTNAVVLTSGQHYTKTWTYDNYKLNNYNKITIPTRGYITFTAEKPIDESGDICAFKLDLYDQQGAMVWAAKTSPQEDTFNANYVYKIGLDAGTYYMNVLPDFYLLRTSEPVVGKYGYTFTASNYWEIESNNDQASATALTLGKTYYGVYREESYETTYKDFFKVNLKKGTRYRLTIGNYKELEEDTLIEDMFDPNGKDILPYEYTEKNNACYWVFEAKTSGDYYVQLRNDGNEIGTEYTICVDYDRIDADTLTTKLSATSYAYDGKTKTPSVVVKDANGKKLKKGTDYTVKYPSGRKAVGKYKVTVTFKGKYVGTKTLSYTIKATKKSSLSVLVGATAKIGAKSNKKITYTTSNKKVAKVSSKGVVTGLKKGTATITVKTNGVSQKIKVSVKKPSVSISGKKTVYRGSSIKLSAEVMPKGQKVKWSVNNKKVAKISSSGKLSALKTGKVTVTAKITYKGKTYKDTFKVTVKKETPTVKTFMSKKTSYDKTAGLLLTNTSSKTITITSYGYLHNPGYSSLSERMRLFMVVVGNNTADADTYPKAVKVKPGQEVYISYVAADGSNVWYDDDSRITVSFNFNGESYTVNVSSRNNSI